MASAGTPLAIRFAMRCVIARVLPLPAPARISTGPSVVSTASRCCGLSLSRKDKCKEAPRFTPFNFTGDRRSEKDASPPRPHQPAQSPAYAQPVGSIAEIAGVDFLCSQYLGSRKAQSLELFHESGRTKKQLKGFACC